MWKGTKKSMLLCLFVGLAACLAVSCRPVGNHNVPQPAKAVDLDRYLGRWYELYRYEAPFEKDCEAVTADYSLNRDGTIRVLNGCRKGAVDGPFKSATGKAKVVDKVTNAKLEVTFFWPFYGDYWVLDHADDYAWSIVGEPSGTYLWILSRDPRPSDDLMEMLRRRAEGMGYDWSLVRQTRQQR